MEFQYKTIVSESKDFQGKPYLHTTYQCVKPKKKRKITGGDFCCERMEDMFGDGFIKFSDWGSPEVWIFWSEPGWDGDSSDREEPINFCPWCGEKILLKEVEKVKQIEVIEEVTEVRKVVKYREEKV